MKVSVEIILSIFLFAFLFLAIKEYLQNDRNLNLKIQSRLKLSVIFFLVIIFNLLINKV